MTCFCPREKVGFSAEKATFSVETTIFLREKVTFSVEFSRELEAKDLLFGLRDNRDNPKDYLYSGKAALLPHAPCSMPLNPVNLMSTYVNLKKVA